ncbi:MAG: hypothetical protein QCH35_01745 [Methanomicrobiaceae archaeon]|nr:hypothetical protein [Methanomicrobiaceae archaeon]
MKGWVLDSAVAIASLFIFLVCLIVFPLTGLGAGFAYIAAISVFILVMSAAGVWVGTRTI